MLNRRLRLLSYFQETIAHFYETQLKVGAQNGFESHQMWCRIRETSLLRFDCSRVAALLSGPPDIDDCKTVMPKEWLLLDGASGGGPSERGGAWKYRSH